MKKLLALMLATMMIFTLVACSADSSAKIKEYVEANEDVLVSSVEQGFAQSGMTCNSSVEVEGNGFAINININELDEVDDAIKSQMQLTYDSMSSVFDAMLTEAQKELPELEYIKVNVCEKDGDVLATITAD